MATGPAESKPRLTRANAKQHCPVCDGNHKCSWTQDGLFICGRRSGDVPGFRCLGVSEDPQFHLYRRADDPRSARNPFHVKAKNFRNGQANGQPEIDWAGLAATLAAAMPPTGLAELAEQLKLPESALSVLAIGFAEQGPHVGKEPCFTFPEVNGCGVVIGITCRYENGDKKAWPGGHRGLTLPAGWREHDGPLLLVEGPSDVLAASALGLSAIGRPSNQGGVDRLAELLKNFPAERPVVVVGEHDADEQGRWPGRDGAVKTADELAQLLGRPVQWVLPPKGHKDLRTWALSLNENAGDCTWPDLGRQVLAEWEGKYQDAKAQAAGASDPDPWQEIIPLSEVPAVEPFPAHVLAGDLPDYLDGSAEALNCPADYLGVPLLAVAGAAIGASRALEVKPGWTERANLYAAVVGRPGTVKTAAQKTVCGPVYLEQKRLATEYRQRKQEWEKQDKDTRPPKPKLPTVYVSDITTEKVAEVLQDNPRGVVLIRDELTAWVASLDQYRARGRGSDRQFYLSAWAGEPVSVHRKNLDEPIFVPHPFVAVVGGLPPDLLVNLRGERAISDGFFDRILAVYPEPPPAAAETWACIPEKPSWAWYEVMEFLRALKPEKDGDGERPHFVRLDASGRKVWERFTAHLADDMNGDTLPDCLRGPWSKHRGYCARLALIVHYLRIAVGEVNGEDVDGESMDRAARLIGYFQSHCRRVYATLEADPTVAKAKRLWEWIVREGRTEFKAWEPHKDIKSRGEFPSVEALYGPLQRLERHSYIRPRLPADRRGPGRPPATVYEVNPLARDHRVNRGNPENAREP